MSASHIDTERISEPAGGPTVWTDEEAAHLAGCADCRLEVAMVAAARRIGAAQLAGFDANRVAAGVRSQLRTQPDNAPRRIPRHPGRWLAGLAAAAAVVLAVRLGIPTSPGSSRGADHPLPAVGSVLHELDGLTEPQLDAVLHSIPPASEALDHQDMALLSDLNATDLERVLRSMEEP